jgi:hypothetical protein
MGCGSGGDAQVANMGEIVWVSISNLEGNSAIIKRDWGDMPEKSKAVSGSSHISTIHVGTISW